MKLWFVIHTVLHALNHVGFLHMYANQCRGQQMLHRGARFMLILDVLIRYTGSAARFNSDCGPYGRDLLRFSFLGIAQQLSGNPAQCLLSPQICSTSVQISYQ